MKIKKIYVFFVLVFLFTNSISALEIGPVAHKFYGEVKVNGETSNNNLLTANINGENYSTITKDGSFGYSPNSFFVEDPDYTNAGDEIKFYVGGKHTGVYIFENGGMTFLNFSLTTNCSDGFCLGTETCSSCSTDCGICTELPMVTIISPTANTVYNSTQIKLEVSSDQNIKVWMYSLNSGSETILTINPKMIDVVEGANTLKIIAMNEYYQTGQAAVTFSVDLPDSGSTLSNSGGGGSGSKKKITPAVNSTNTTIVILSDTISVKNESETGNNADEIQTVETTEEENKGVMSVITGAFVGVFTSPAKYAWGWAIFIAIVICFFIVRSKLKNKKPVFDKKGEFKKK